MAERHGQNRGERLLALAGAAGFALLVVGAVLLWAREGTLVYLTRVIEQLPNCF